MKKPARIGISNKLRFEIIRRDGSQCRYCGRAAPDVQIEVDHIIPVVLGGTNDLLNLVAACFECNSGKGARRLDDATMQRQQMGAVETLEERMREQQEILARYETLKRVSGNQISQLLNLWWDVSGQSLDERYGPVLRKWIDLFGFETVVKSMHAAAGRDIRAVGAYAAVTLMDQKEPGTRQCYLIRGLLRKKFKVDDRYHSEGGNWVSGRPIDEKEIIDNLLCFMRYGAPLDELLDAAKTATSYGEFCYLSQEITERAYNARVA